MSEPDTVQSNPAANAKPLRKMRHIRIRRCSWRKRATARRQDPVDPAFMAVNASHYAVCAMLWRLLCKAEKQRTTPLNDLTTRYLDQQLEQHEQALGVKSAALSPLVEIFAMIEGWQKEHLVDEATLIEVLAARMMIAVESLNIERRDVFSNAFAKAQADLCDSH